ncbi:hypothetical protein L6R50_02665 [Myxococcota bacterium]|nr:hypothetical protein [Myxococcota bacterium]
MDPRRDPRARLARQATLCRAAFRALAPDARSSLASRLRSTGDALDACWAEVLEGPHPLAAWLEGEDPFDALPSDFARGPSARQLVSSHPFTGFHPWLHACPPDPRTSP